MGYGRFLGLGPPAGAKIEGLITVQAETHIGLVCWNLFNATVSSDRLPKDWKWSGGASSMDDRRAKRRERLKNDSESNAEHQTNGAAQDLNAQEQGHWVDGGGERVDGQISFDVVMVDAEGGNQQEGNYVSIVGTMLDPEDEVILTKEKKDALQERRSWKKEPMIDSGPSMTSAVRDES